MNTYQKQIEMPHNIEAEQIVIGAAILNNELINEISEYLLPEHFYDPAHKTIYEAITTLLEKGITAHPVSIHQHLNHTEMGVQIKEKNYISYLTSIAMTVFKVSAHAGIVYDLAIRRQLISIGSDIIETATSSGLDKDALSQVELAESSLFRLVTDGSKDSGFSPIKIALSKSINHINECRKRDDKITGIPTGFTDLNDILSGFHNSDLLILAARPGMGKTTLALNFAFSAAGHFLDATKKNASDKQDSKVVGIFSLEMQSEQLATKLISMESHVNSANLLSGRISEEQYNYLMGSKGRLSEMPIYIDDTAALSIGAIRTRARRLKRKYNLGLLFIDYLQLVQPSKKTDNRVLEITEITQNLKALAKELNIPIIALSQLSRAVEQRQDKRPLLSDLRESGSIEQDADIVMFIYRDDYYNTIKNSETQSDNKNKAEIIIAKHRNGRVGVVTIGFNPEVSKFQNS